LQAIVDVICNKYRQEGKRKKISRFLERYEIEKERAKQRLIEAGKIGRDIQLGGYVQLNIPISLSYNSLEGY